MIAPAPAAPVVLLCANTLCYLWNFRGSTIQALQDQGFRVVCVGGKDTAEAALTAMDCEVVALDWRQKGLDPFHEFGIVWQLWKMMRRVRPVVCFSFTFKANVDVSLAARLAGIPYVTNVPGLGGAFLRNELRYRLVRRLHGLANTGAYATFFQNATDLGHFHQAGLSAGRRVQVIPGSGVNTKRFPFRPLTGQVTTFLMIARLLRDKGVAEYLVAAAELKHEKPALRFLLAGPPDEFDAGDVARMGGAVEYLGELKDVRPALLRSDCLVLPSYREGMPRAVLEAASMGRICVVTDVPGCRDAIAAGKSGILCQPRSASSLAEAMRQASRLRAPTVGAMSRQARELAETRFDEGFCIQPYLAIAETLSGPPAGTDRGSGPAAGRPADRALKASAK